MWFRLRKYISVIVLPITMPLIFGCGGGSTTPPTYSISGKVAYDGASIPGVAVHLSSSDASVAIPDVASDNTGTYTFNGITAGTYTVSSADSKYGFASQTITVPDVAKSLIHDMYPLFTITGKIIRETTAEAIPGATVTLYGTHFDIYTIDAGLYGATVTTDASGKPVQTDSNGSYSFKGVAPGAYTIKPSSPIYVFNPDKSGALTITRGSTIYVYNPEALGNSVIDNVIYNSSFMITDNTIPNQDFRASPPGGVSQP